MKNAFTESRALINILEQDHVFVHPGYFFDFTKGVFLVLSLLTPSDIFQEGMERLLRRIREQTS